MSISLFFGLPGSGKTTVLTQLACKGVKNKKYTNVYCNVDIKVPGVTYIKNDFIGKYNLCDGLLLIDESILFANCRNWKSIADSLVEFLVQYRHFGLDIVFFSQRVNGLDSIIRDLTDNVYYVHKPFFIGKWITKYYRIPYGIIFPDPKSNKMGEILQGYCKPPLLNRLISPIVFRPLYYKYFDSWERFYLPPLPAQYKPYYPGMSCPPSAS